MGLVEDSDTEDDYDNDKSERIRIGEDSGHINIANVEQTETWRDVMINPELSEADQSKLWSLIQEYGDIFSDVPTPTNLLTYDIKLRSDEPIRHKPYKIPVHLVDKVEQE
jgi:hypothetical protein